MKVDWAEHRFKVTRRVTQQECRWLKRDIEEGEVVYEYFGLLYGLVGSGIAVTEQPDMVPWFELPHNAVERIKTGEIVVVRDAVCKLCGNIVSGSRPMTTDGSIICKICRDMDFIGASKE